MKLENPSRYILAVLAAEGQIEADSKFGIPTGVFNVLSSDATFSPTVKNILIFSLFVFMQEWLNYFFCQFSLNTGVSFLKKQS